MSVHHDQSRHPDQESLERAVGDVFCRVLEIEEIGRDDSFLEMGGNSLMAMQVVSLLREELGINLSLGEFFDTLTVASTVGLVLGAETDTAPSALNPESPSPEIRANSPMRLSLYFFAGDESASRENKYQLVLESAQFADQNGFEAVWLPERHFNRFGGLYPNPAVLGAAIAAITRNLHIRGGSVVAPLHHPVEIAEQWSMLDNLSQGRIGVSFGSGFHPRDFVLAPDAFADRQKRMFASIDDVHRLWRGESIAGIDGNGRAREVRIYPTPFSETLPTWLTTSRSIDTFRQAGQRGFNLLTAFLRLTWAELEENIRAYRLARAQAGFDPGSGQVTLMLHTFIGKDSQTVRSTVEKPLKTYLGSHMNHTESLKGATTSDPDIPALSTADKETLLDHALQRYLDSGSLIGTVDSCRDTLHRLRDIGVDEIACLVDFGVPEAALGNSLRLLSTLVG